MATHAHTSEDDGLERGKEIDWSLVIPSITRPTWEAPALEVLDAFEHMPMEEIRRAIPTPTVRSQFLDLYGEFTTLMTYVLWAGNTSVAAKQAGDMGKKQQYEALMKTAMVDMKEVYVEWRRFSVEIKAVIDHAGSELAKSYETFDGMFGLREEDFEPASVPVPSPTPNVPGSGHELRDPIDLISNDCNDEKDINAIFRSTGVSELITLDQGSLSVAKRMTYWCAFLTIALPIFYVLEYGLDF